jgi:hypothetical protein
MMNETPRDNQAANDGTLREDEPIPQASEDEVLDDTVRLVREGRKELASDPREPKASKD